MLVFEKGNMMIVEWEQSLRGEMREICSPPIVPYQVYL